MQALSWDGMVELHDETRTFDAGCFAAALDWVEERLPLPSCRRVLEPGIGNGRIALPLAARGYDVTGFDISGEMVASLRRRLDAPLAGGVAFLAADVCDLPFAGGSFDWAIAVH